MKKIITYIVVACSIASAIPAFAHEGSPNASKAPYDIQFLDTMTQHHRDGIKMMEMAVDKSQSDEITRMAQKGINDQTNDIDELGAIREEVKADAPEAIKMKLPGMMPMDKDMAKLEAASGSDFDRRYLRTMIKHHQGGVKMSDDALRWAKNAEVKAKAQEIHDKQKSEIDAMESMLKRSNNP